MRLHMILPRVEPSEFKVPTACPYPGCQGKHLELHQTVVKPVKDTGCQVVSAHRYRCLRCGRTFRVYPQGVTHDRRQQMVTVIKIVSWAVAVVIVGAGVLMLLSRFDINITPLLASAGVTGLAVGLGAQTLIKDLIGGFFIVAENQYAVGDTIQVGALSGQVERLTLRATSLRDDNGRVHIIPNGEARIVSNLTKEWSRAVVDVSVAYGEELDRVLRVLGETAETFARDEAWGRVFLEAPQTLGPISLDDQAVGVRVMVKTRPGQQWEVSRELRKRILAACEREGIAPAYPRREVWVRDWQRCEAGSEGTGQLMTG